MPHWDQVKAVLISTYELGRQPFGLASPAAWLRKRGHDVSMADLSLDSLPAIEIRDAALVAIYLPMHTATRLAVPVIERIRSLNPDAHLCCYGLYAPLNESYLRRSGVHSIIGGEFEAALAALADKLAFGEMQRGGPAQPVVTLERLSFLAPDRTGLPVLARYPKLVTGSGTKVAGYTEASRGCKHLCRHCPVVPVYRGSFRVVQAEVVLEDIRRQIAGGAEHITFGDPDFLNGPAHAARIVEAVHFEFPDITYDITTKVEHLLAHADLIGRLKSTGCLFVTTAVESIEDEVLSKLQKGHTRDQFIRVVELFAKHELTMAPTFIPFHPWTTIEGYRRLLDLIRELDLVENVAPVQLALRLLIPSTSRLLELQEVRSVITDFDEASLSYRWRHADPSVDALSLKVLRIVDEGTRQRRPRSVIFRDLCRTVQFEYEPMGLMPRVTIPYMEEPWFC